ncbi:PREDICTED: uncharacterized protein LOC109233927 [Nicotiana attenuata]|uniref:uncharacterized protein LOC109233927 n=1 Tax=Nicotiana attenuata TaxID=49451 RepID=UPI000904C4F8|nr:PREDICTED: uncharacterized protein LOC109233927 [Nicotiana attenuata]
MTTIPWMIGGDFNVVLQLQDRMHGNPVTKAETQDFSKCIQELKLKELAWEGDYYTWSNKQDGGDRIWSDRIFVYLWKQRFHNQKTKNAWMKLKALRIVLKKLNVGEFKFIKKKIELGRIELEQVQKNIDTDNTSDMLLKEKELIQNLEKWSMIEEGALKQKAGAK